MRGCLLCLALILLVSCTASPTVQPTLRGPIVPTRVIPTATPTDTASPTLTSSPTLTPSLTPTLTLTPTATATLTFTATMTFTATTAPTQIPPSDTPTIFVPPPSDTPTIFVPPPSNTPDTSIPPSDTPTILVPSPTDTPTEMPTIAPTAGEPTFFRNSTALNPIILTGSLALDDTVSNTIDNQHPAVLYTFQGKAGTNIDLKMSKNSGDLDAYLLVLDPKGREMARNDDLDSDNHDAGIHDLPLPETGTYVIVATRYGQQFGETTGDFDLAIRATEEGESAIGLFSLPTGYGSLVNGTLDSDNSEFIYTFRATAGDVVNIQMTQTSGNLDPNLSLTDNLGTIIAANDDNLLTGTLDSAIQGFIIPKSGYYSIIASHFTGQDNSGDFRLKLALVSQNAADRDAIVNTINSSTINDKGSFYTNYSIGDEINDSNEEHTFQTLLTFYLPPLSDQQRIQSATFTMQPCYQRGGGFATLGTMTIYQDNYGSLSQSRDLTHPQPGARVLSTQSSCDPIDLTSIVQDAYANGVEEIQLRLIFRSHTDNGVEDEVLITPNLRLSFEG